MGCFNTTGFISQLPILGGDKVVCFIALAPNYTGPNSLYSPSALAAPYFFPIYGEYNEYGYLEGVQETFVTNLLVKYSKEKSIEDLLIKELYEEACHIMHYRQTLTRIFYRDYLPIAEGNEQIAMDFLKKAYTVNEDDEAYVKSHKPEENK